MKKRFLSLILILTLTVSLFSACQDNAQDETTTTSGAISDTDVSSDTVADTSAETTGPEETTTVKEEEPIPGGYATYKEAYEAGEEIPALYERHEDVFSIGVALGYSQVRNPDYADIAARNFNSLTAENEMKPNSVIDINLSASNLEEYDLSPAIKYSSIDSIMSYAKENNMKVRFHTLIWHSQTPTAFFKEGYKLSGENVSREVMIARMESYIKQVLEYLDNTYPGMVYAVDVVNEAIDPGDSRPDGMRETDSLWFQVIGPDFVELAFTYARKYAPDYMKLYYNDYNCHETSKRYHISEMLKPLIEKGLVDGMGLQSHYSLGTPTTINLQDVIMKYAELGLEIQITELDIDTTDDSEEGLLELAKRYKKLINLYRYMKENNLANITNVTVWGLTDAQSWLNKTEKKYPLLFDRAFAVKDAFWGMYQDESIPNY